MLSHTTIFIMFIYCNCWYIRFPLALLEMCQVKSCSMTEPQQNVSSELFGVNVAINLGSRWKLRSICDLQGSFTVNELKSI